MADSVVIDTGADRDITVSDGTVDDEGTDASLDIAHDAVADTGTDTSSDILADTLADTASDTARDTAPIPDTTDPTAPFRIAAIADTHVLPISPGHEYNGAVLGLLHDIATYDPDIRALFTLGDNIDDLATFFDWALADPNVQMIIDYKAFMTANVPMPWFVTLGNHDNRFFDTFSGNEVPMACWAAQFAGSTELPSPWYSVQIRGFNFIVLFGCDGATDHATNDTNIIGPDQLLFLNAELDKGMPSILLYHQWLDAPLEGAALHPIHQAIIDHPGVVKASLAGHGHAFMHYTWEGTEFYQIGAAKEAGTHAAYGTENGFLSDFGYFECDPQTGSVTLLNADNIVWNQAADVSRSLHFITRL